MREIVYWDKPRTRGCSQDRPKTRKTPRCPVRLTTDYHTKKQPRKSASSALEDLRPKSARTMKKKVKSVDFSEGVRGKHRGLDLRIVGSSPGPKTRNNPTQWECPRCGASFTTVEQFDAHRDLRRPAGDPIGVRLFKTSCELNLGLQKSGEAASRTAKRSPVVVDSKTPAKPARRAQGQPRKQPMAGITPRANGRKH